MLDYLCHPLDLVKNKEERQTKDGNFRCCTLLLLGSGNLDRVLCFPYRVCRGDC